MKISFQALLVERTTDEVTAKIETLTLDDLPKGDVVIKVSYSTINYKDVLGLLKKGNVVTKYPMVLGIDMVGEVVVSESPLYKEGDKVIATSYDIGVSHYGGFSEYARVKSEWLVPLPRNMTEREAMIYGTAGFTAGLSIYELQRNGITSECGEILITGATGGVGSHAALLLSHLGYNVVASTGKEECTNYLKKIGVSRVISREEVIGEEQKALKKQKWAGVVDAVGGKTLSGLLPSVQRNGVVAVSGMVGGKDIHTTVFPFILRGVRLIGIDSAYCDMKKRAIVWQRLSTEWKAPHLNEIVREEITLQETIPALQELLSNNSIGKFIIKI